MQVRSRGLSTHAAMRDELRRAAAGRKQAIDALRRRRAAGEGGGGGGQPLWVNRALLLKRPKEQQARQIHHG